jgi:succinate dehydrogenase/fumarate reductase cytochrome b subunit
VLLIPHALNGFRVFAIDFGISERAQRILFWTLTVFGIFLIIWVYFSRVSG